MEEHLDVIDSSGKVIGRATRQECHSNNLLAHRAVHVLVFNSKGELFLQKRSMSKDIQPGKWDTSVGGHLNPGETFDQAATREMREELGISADVRYIYSYWMHSPVETEYISTYICIYNGTIRFNPHEIEDGRFWSRKEIEENLSTGIFTPNFEQEYEKYLQWQKGSKKTDL